MMQVVALGGEGRIELENPADLRHGVQDCEYGGCTNNSTRDLFSNMHVYA
jgi:hypothetical protein